MLVVFHSLYRMEPSGSQGTHAWVRRVCYSAGTNGMDAPDAPGCVESGKRDDPTQVALQKQRRLAWKRCSPAEQSINGCGRCHTGIHASNMRNLRVASHTRIAAGVALRTSAALLCHTRTTRRRTCHTAARATNDIRSTRTNLEAGTQCQAAGTQSAMELPVTAGSGGAGLHIASGMGCRARPTKLSCN